MFFLYLFYRLRLSKVILADQSIYNIEALENLATSFRVICRAVPSLCWGRGEIKVYKYKV